MFRIPKFISLLATITTLTSPFAVAEDGPDISLGAHAFLDYENVDINDMTVVDGTNLRLFRVDIGGKFNYMKFTSTTDFQNDDVTIQDLFVEFSGDTRIRIGNFKIMNGLEQESSLYARTFTEINSVSGMNGHGRMLGVAAYRSFGNVNVSGGIFSANANSAGASDEWAVSGRISTAISPTGGDDLIHLGASARHRENSDGSLYGYKSKPFAKSSPSTVTASKLSDSDTFVGLEGVYLNKGFSLQSEYGLTKADCASAKCSDDPEFQAFYLDASYIWGGERVIKKGLIKRTKVYSPASDGGTGAFQIAARFDMADLNDGVTTGGKQTNWAVGGSWYRDKYIRVHGNFIHTDFDDSPAYGDGSADAFVVRLQAELY